jgi:hypothetical protein
MTFEGGETDGKPEEEMTEEAKLIQVAKKQRSKLRRSAKKKLVKA